MSFLFLTRKLACIVAAILPAIASAQSGFAPLGGEYAIVGALPASQTRPQVSVNSGGGYIVWQDQNTFGNRWTVMGRPLNSGLNYTLPAFRVNSSATGDHENPRVALLKDGGAVFVWQGGQFSFQHIYARFLSPGNTWSGLDQLVNASAKTYQTDPKVVVLENGNVVVVYSTFNSDSMQDVYGQMYSPAGIKLGTEFQINEYTAQNQRSPSIAALTNGGFIVTWVSEQQRAVESVSSGQISVAQIARPSVDIYARLFNADGTPANGEFLVSDGSNVSAQPAVAAGSDGGVMIVWSSLDVQVRNNGWDIIGRAFTFSGNIPQAGAQGHLNTQLFGDQFSPQLSVLGTTYLAIWTSLGQDGSREGVYGQYLNTDGTHAGNEIRINTTTFGMQQQPALTTDGDGRFLAAWTSPTFGPSKNDLYAQIFASATYTPGPLVANYGSPAFIGQTASSIKTPLAGIHDPSMDPPTLEYPGGWVAIGSGAPATNGFALAEGKYNGLFYSLNGVSSASAGYFTATVDAKRGYSAKLTFTKGTYSISGKLDDQGNSGAKLISRKAAGLPSLTVSFQVDLSGADQIYGQVNCGGDWNAAIYADRQVYSKSQPSPLAGSSILTIPGFENGPGGTSFGTIGNGIDGGVSLAGTLADGNKIAQKSVLSKNGICPLFAPVTGGGMIIGWVDFSAGNPDNELAWIKPSIKGGGLYQGGFTNRASAVISPLSPPVPGERILSLSGAGLGQVFSYDFALDAGGTTNMFVSSSTNLVVSYGLVLGADGNSTTTNGITLTVSPASGVFTGKVPNPIAGKSAIPIYGVLLNGGAGEGFFKGTTASGQVTLQQP